MNVDLPGGPPRETFHERRRRAFEGLGRGAMVLPAAPVQHSSRDNERPYVPDRELYYLTGLTEPESVAVLVGGDEPRLELFVRERDAEAELWSGPRIGVDGAREAVGPDACHPLDELAERLPGLVQAADRIHVRLGSGGAVERLVLAALSTARARGARAGTGPRGIVDPGEILDELRLVKDGHELELLRAACAVTTDGHRAAAAAITPGVGEFAVEATIDAAFRATGAAGAAYDTIVGSGPNACVLHYVTNQRVVAEGDLVLIDAGAEVGLYRGDVTRTFPVSGRFTPEQLEVYDLVEAARAAAVEVVRPGATIADVHETAARTITRGLVDLGVLEGDVDGLVEQKAYKPFFPHQTSHWLGLDVHDPGDYARGGEPRVLEPGMVFTVEPGLYFRPGRVDAAAARFEGIGVRIEDDVAVTAEGREVLTRDLPTAASEVAALVGR